MAKKVNREPMPPYYLTTPIYYVNARPHLGHTYSTIVADAIRRFQRQQGLDAYLLTGTDEHGQKVERAARSAGLSPQEFTDRISHSFRSLWDQLGLQYDFFLRTTEPRHARAVQAIFQRCYDAGYIYRDQYKGAYCFFDELYVTEGRPGTPCPQCGRPTEEVSEENYFFKLSAFEDRLLKHYEEHPEFIRPEVRRNEVLSFVRGGLKDLSISRSNVKWGIPLPIAEGQVFYVWFDALTSYMSGIGFAQGGEEEEWWKRLWPADLHLVGKEILRFHAVYWPAFLMAADLPLPRGIYAHGWLLFEEDKMSKSRGNIVRPQPIQQVVGMDGLRYFLLREIVFGQDGSFSYDALVGRYISDLANDLGNLVQRTLTMIARYFDGEVPYPSALAERTEADSHVAAVAGETIQSWRTAFQAMEFTRGLESVWTLVSAVNKYIVENEPWALAEQGNRARLATVLYTSAEALRILSVLLYPVMPASAQRIWEQLGQRGDLGAQRLDELHWSQLAHGERIGKVEAIFPRLDQAEAIERLRKLEAELAREEALPVPDAAAAPASAAVQAPSPKLPDTSRRTPSSASPAAAGLQAPFAATTADARISIEDFAKVDMRVGQVRAAERVKGTSKLLKLDVDIGSEVRQVVAGIAEVYTPEELVGSKVVLVANLAPRRLRGVESNGMILAATVGPDGKPVLVTVPEAVPNGSRLR